MLFKQHILEAIARGEVTLAFRRWKSSPRVSTLRTSIGVLSIGEPAEVRESSITEREARLAGFADRAALLAELKRHAGKIYRMSVRLAGPDPRIALREDDELDDGTLAMLRQKLARLDAASKRGPWTMRTLKQIGATPSLAAVNLAKLLKVEKEWLKLNVRKLKNLGLTISLHPGYRLSPRGVAMLKSCERK